MIGFGTKKWKGYWEDRYVSKEDADPDAWKHPHRFVISAILKNFAWQSLFEVGCGTGSNLVNIVKTHRHKQVGGIDVNSKFIKIARSMFKGGALLKVNSVEDMMMSDKSCDVLLSDMTLIYISPWKIKKVLREIVRVTRNKVVFCELHCNFWADRQWMRLTDGYNIYDYKRLLEKYGFYDIQYYKLTEEDWPGGEPQRSYGYIFVANVPKKIR